jgi:hypothetical protein
MQGKSSLEATAHYYSYLQPGSGICAINPDRAATPPAPVAPRPHEPGRDRVPVP